MGIGQVFALGPIMHHQQPAAQALFHRMQGIARDGLHDLRHQRLGIADEKILHLRAALKRGLQGFDIAAQDRPL